MFKKGLTFKARIKSGTSCDYDHCSRGRWPNLWRKADVDLLFDAEDCGNHFNLVAPGFGVVGGDYGNGSLFVTNMNDLIIDPKDAERIKAARRATKQKELDKAVAEVARLHSEIGVLAPINPPATNAAN